METYIVKIKGHQYRVKKGDKIDVEKIEGKEGTTIEFTDVLLVKNEKEVKVGTPIIKGSSVKAKILEQFKGPKVEIVKFKKKDRYLKRQGHRQNYTKIEIL